MPSLTPAHWALAIVAVLFIGLSKAGFGGGLGILTTPLCVIAFGPRAALGILLPLLCAGDAFSLQKYWRKWDARNLRLLLPGVVLGVLFGVQLFNRFSARELNVVIGFIAVTFVVFQVSRERLFKDAAIFRPDWRSGIPFGIGAGLTSTFAHGAGPVVTMFLLPQRLPKEIFVGTNVLIFTWINWIKFPFFVANRQITILSLKESLVLFPLVPIGVWLGVWMNRRISDSHFRNVIYVLTFLAGLQLIFDWHW